MQRIDLESIAEALKLLQRYTRDRDEDEAQAWSLLLAILNRHGHELEDFQPPALVEQRRERLIAAIESGLVVEPRP